MARYRLALLCWRSAISFWVSMHALQARAELDSEDYQSRAQPRSPTERAALQLRLQQERAAEVMRQEQLERLQHQRERMTQAWLDARPAEEKWLRAQCTRCHGLGVIEPARFGWLGWAWTIARMRWLHGADVELQAIGTLASYLTQRGRKGLPPVEPMPDFGPTALGAPDSAQASSHPDRATRVAPRTRH